MQNIQKKVIEDGKYKYSNFFISEHFTERFFEGKKTDLNLVAKHIVDILNIIKSLNNLHINSPFNSKDIMHIYVERLFATFYSKGLLNEKLFIENEELIVDLKIKNILLYISKKDLQYRVEETFTKRNDIWRKYVNDNGGISKFIDKLLKEQDSMIDFDKNILSKYVDSEIVDVSNLNDNFYSSII